MKIPIKKTNRKVPRSPYQVKDKNDNLVNIGIRPDGTLFATPVIVNFPAKGLENPLDVQSIEIDRVFDEHYNNIVLSEALDYKNQKGDWNEWHKDMEESLREQDNFNKKHKETISLLTRIKRIGRKKQ